MWTQVLYNFRSLSDTFHTDFSLISVEKLTMSIVCLDLSRYHLNASQMTVYNKGDVDIRL